MTGFLGGDAYPNRTDDDLRITGACSEAREGRSVPSLSLSVCPRVLRSQFRRLDYLAGCDLRRHTWRLLLGMAVLRDSDGAAHRDLALRRPLRISAPVRLH